MPMHTMSIAELARPELASAAADACTLKSVAVCCVSDPPKAPKGVRFAPTMKRRRFARVIATRVHVECVVCFFFYYN